MSITDSSNQKLNNVDQHFKLNIANIYLLSKLLDMTPVEKIVFLSIGEYSLGYKRKTTNIPSNIGINKNANSWAKDLGISKPTFLRAIKSLASKKYIQIHNGSQRRENGGSYPDYYSIIFQKDLQKKHKIFFNISNDDNKDTKHKQKQISDYTKEEINSMSFNEKYFLTHGKEPDHLEI